MVLSLGNRIQLRNSYVNLLEPTVVISLSFIGFVGVLTHVRVAEQTNGHREGGLGDCTSFPSARIF